MLTKSIETKVAYQISRESIDSLASLEVSATPCTADSI